MQTRCPHCETRFRVTDSQLASADGYVRCGICEQVFNAYSDDEVIADELTPDEAGPDEKITDNEISHQVVANDVEGQTSTSDISIDQRSDISESDFISEETEDDLSGDALETHTHREPEDKEVETDESSEQSDEYTTAPENEVEFENKDPSYEGLEYKEPHLHEQTDTDENSTDEDYPTGISSTSGKNLEDSYDLFDDREENRDHVVPEEFRSGYDNSHHSTLATALWSIGILFLIATLFLEYIWFNRDHYVQIPQIHAEIEKLCQQFDCDGISLRVPDEIELLSRNVYSHPNNKDGLIVDITMKNNAAFSQPYPILKIEFSDIRGQVIASRNFQPREYLSIVQQNTESVATLPPDTSSSVTLEVKDPGKQAMTYEFDFL